ncbi:MAG TPA: hypothetical protein VMD97_02810 [Candidatus Aquilonibacter sp.]|nr:hypothetical protein [Candidatus Aquilonibacter sp.]
MLHRRRRDRELAAAATWPVVEAHLLKPVIVAKDKLAEGTAAQDSQVEIPYYFTLAGEGAASGYFGGHLRTVALSYSEGSRLLPRIVEGTMVRVRYDPKDPDRNHALDKDNEGVLPVGVWSS